MKKIFFILSINFFFITGYCQDAHFEKPDYVLIKSQVNKKDSNTYYPKLIKRYDQNDTTLTAEEYKLLYYGFLFQKEYSVYGRSDYRDSLKRFYSKDTLLPADYDTIITYEKLVLNKFPFNLQDLNTLAYAYTKKDDFASARLINFKLNSLITTILATGDGKTVQTGFHVISVDHEYDLLEVLGLKFGGSQSLIGQCDYLTVQENDFNLKGVYFDVTKVLEAESKLFDH